MSTVRLVIVALGLIGFYSVLLITSIDEETSYKDLQLEAVMLMQEAMDALKAERISRGIPIDGDVDPLETGIIGIPWPDFDEPTITTTLGLLESKQLSTNPNFAALMVRYFQDLGLRQGDTVAVNFSGSFPALNIATLAAIEVMKLNPLIASTIGASTYGANHPEFTWIDMEAYLVTNELFSHKSRWVSLGGDNDRLEEFDQPVFIQQLRERITLLGYTVIDEDDLSTNIRNRYREYHQSGIAISVFINIGGNMLSFGRHMVSHPTGLTRRMSVSVRSDSGLIERFLRDDIPVIHILNIRDLSRRHGMQLDGNIPFEIGVGTMYIDERYHVAIPLASLGFIGIVFYGDKVKKKLNSRFHKE